MILDPMPLWQAYGMLNRFCWESPHPKLITRAAKIYSHGTVLIRPWKLFGFWKFSGYGRNKLPSLQRTYMTDERLDLISQKIARREKKAGRISSYSSLGAAMGTGKKDSPKKTGECIQGISFDLIPKRDSDTGEPTVDVHVFFRVTEITRRLLGDFVFIDHAIKKVLGPRELLPCLGTVTLHLGTYYPILYHFVLWMRMIDRAEKRIHVKDPFKPHRWKSHIYEGTTGRSCASHHRKLTHSPKICAAEIYKNMKGEESLFYVDNSDYGVTLNSKYKKYDGPVTG